MNKFNFNIKDQLLRKSQIKKYRKNRITSYLPSPELCLLVASFYNAIEATENRRPHLKTKINTTRLLAVLTETDLIYDRDLKAFIISQNYVKSIAKSLGIQEQSFRDTMKFISRFKVQEHNRFLNQASAYDLPTFEPKFGSQKKLIKALKTFFKKDNIKPIESLYKNGNSHISKKSILDINIVKNKTKANSNKNSNKNSNTNSDSNEDKTIITDSYKFWFKRKNVNYMLNLLERYQSLERPFINNKNEREIYRMINFIEGFFTKNNPDFFNKPYLNVTEKTSINNGRVFSQLTSLPKKIRYILFNFWISIDINNAAPNLLLNAALKVEPTLKDKIPHFKRYAKTREAFFSEMYNFHKPNISYDTFKKVMKQLFLTIIFGSRFEYNFSELNKVIKALNKILEKSLEAKKEGKDVNEVIEAFIKSLKAKKAFDTSLGEIFLSLIDEIGFIDTINFFKYHFPYYKKYIENVNSDLKLIAKTLNMKQKDLSNFFMNMETQVMNHILKVILRSKNKFEKIRIHDEILIKAETFSAFELITKLKEIEDYLKENNLSCKFNLLTYKGEIPFTLDELKERLLSKENKEDLLDKFLYTIKNANINDEIKSSFLNILKDLKEINDQNKSNEIIDEVTNEVANEVAIRNKMIFENNKLNDLNKINKINKINLIEKNQINFKKLIKIKKSNEINKKLKFPKKPPNQ